MKATIPDRLRDVLVSTQDTLSGSIRFAGTRVPIQALFDTLEAGGTVEEFLSGFPNVARAQVEAVIAWEQTEARRAMGLERAS